MDLFNLSKLKGKQRKAKRVGRGIGSGKGSHTTGKGQKGQKARTGFNLPFGFEGGQVPLYKKMPKRKGFVNSHRGHVYSLNVDELNSIKSDSTITPDYLVKIGLIKRIPEQGVKILGRGDLTKKLNFSGFSYSKTAFAKIEKLGGEAK